MIAAVNSAVNDHAPFETKRAVHPLRISKGRIDRRVGRRRSGRVTRRIGINMELTIAASWRRRRNRHPRVAYPLARPCDLVHLMKSRHRLPNPKDRCQGRLAIQPIKSGNCNGRNRAIGQFCAATIQDRACLLWGQKRRPHQPRYVPFFQLPTLAPESNPLVRPPNSA